MFSLVLSSRFQLKLRQLLFFQSKRHTLLNWPCKRNSSVYEGYSTHVFTIYRAQYTHVQEHVLIRSTILQKIYVNPLTRLSNSRLSYNIVLPRITYVFVLTVLIRSHSLFFYTAGYIFWCLTCQKFAQIKHQLCRPDKILRWLETAACNARSCKI